MTDSAAHNTVDTMPGKHEPRRRKTCYVSVADRRIDERYRDADDVVRHLTAWRSAKELGELTRFPSRRLRFALSAACSDGRNRCIPWPTRSRGKLFGSPALLADTPQHPLHPDHEQWNAKYPDLDDAFPDPLQKLIAAVPAWTSTKDLHLTVGTSETALCRMLGWAIAHGAITIAPVSYPSDTLVIDSRRAATTPMPA